MAAHRSASLRCEPTHTPEAPSPLPTHSPPIPLSSPSFLFLLLLLIPIHPSLSLSLLFSSLAHPPILSLIHQHRTKSNQLLFLLFSYLCFFPHFFFFYKTFHPHKFAFFFISFFLFLFGSVVTEGRYSSPSYL